jgi:hypothetical protein
MALVYDIKYDYISEIGDKKIKFKQWTAKDERKYLQLIEKKEEKEVTDKSIFDALIAPCIEEKDIVLSASEQNKLLIDIRIESISEYIEDTYECEKCEKESEVKVKIKDCMTYKKADYKEIEAGDLKFVFGDIKSNKEKERLKLEDGVVDYVFTDFLLHIKGIEINGEMQTEFSFRELQKFVDKIPTKIFDEVFEAYRDMVDDLIIETEHICPHCDNKETLDYSYIPNLLWV